MSRLCKFKNNKVNFGREFSSAVLQHNILITLTPGLLRPLSAWAFIPLWALLVFSYFCYFYLLSWLPTLPPVSYLPVWKSYLSSVPFGQPTPEASASVLKLSALQVTPQSGLFGLARSRKPAKCLVSASACSFSSRLLRCAGHLGSRPVTFTSAVSCFPRVCWVPQCLGHSTHWVMQFCNLWFCGMFCFCVLFPSISLSPPSSRLLLLGTICGTHLTDQPPSKPTPPHPSLTGNLIETFPSQYPLQKSWVICYRSFLADCFLTLSVYYLNRTAWFFLHILFT